MFEGLRRATGRHLLAACLLSLLGACGGGGGGSDDDGSGGTPPAPPVPAATLSRVEVAPATASIAAGTSQAFVATAIYSDASRVDVTTTAAWGSSAPAVASVSNDAGSQGLAHAIATGSTTISATFEAQTGSASLTVTAATPVALAVAPGAVTAPKGLTTQFVAELSFSDGSVQDVSAFATWSSSDAGVASVSGGSAQALAVGSATLTAAYGTLDATATLTVTDVAVIGLDVTPSGLTLPAGVAQQYTATARYSDGSTENVTASATWSSSAATVATVGDASGSKGLAQAVAPGSAGIGARYGGATGSSALTVTAAALQSLAVTPATASVPKGVAQPFTASGVYTDGSTADLTTQVTWASSDAINAPVSNAAGSQGLASALNPTTATITATVPGTATTATASFTVTTAVLTSLTVTPSETTIPVGTTTRFTATGLYSDGSNADLTQSATWSVADAAIADISNATGNRGVALGKSTGTTTVTASTGGFAATARLTVSGAALTSISVTPVDARLAVGFTRQYVATGVYSDNSTRDLTTAVTWSTNVATFATVSNADGSRGLVTGVGAGTVNVSARSGSITGVTALTVTSATLTALAVTPTNSTLPVGLTRQLTATGTFSDSSTQDLTSQSSWASGTPAVATVGDAAGSKGLATAVATGSSVISATTHGLTAGTRLLVTTATLTRITVTPNPATVAAGMSTQLTATGLYSDNKTLDITDSVTWSSADTAVATVSNGNAAGTVPHGRVTGIAVGSTTITATLSGISGSGPVAVSDAILSRIVVSPIARSVALGVTVQYLATGVFSDNTTTDLTPEVTWKSTAPAVAEISNADGSEGLATTRATGTTSVTATLGSLVSPAVTLQVTGKALASITVTPSSPGIANGSTLQFAATGTYTDGTSDPLTELVTWASSDTAIAEISNADGTRGLATTKATGTTTISATSGGVGGSTVLTVTSSTLQSISLTPANASLPGGGYQRQYQATGLYADGSSQDLTTQVSWSVFDEAVATISNADGSQGLLTTGSTGSSTLLASLGSISGTTAVTVTTATLSGIDVTPKNASIGSGGSLQYTAIGSFSDGSTLDLTRQVIWGSTNAGAAQIDQSGLATAGSTRNATTTISGRRSGLVGATLLTKTP